MSILELNTQTDLGLLGVKNSLKTTCNICASCATCFIFIGILFGVLGPSLDKSIGN